MKFIIIGMGILGYIAFIYFGIKSEKIAWNHGICAKSNLPWRYFDTDSQGCRGYTDDAGNYIWVSWYVDTLPPEQQ